MKRRSHFGSIPHAVGAAAGAFQQFKRLRDAVEGLKRNRDTTNAQARPTNHAGGPAYSFRKGQAKTFEKGGIANRLTRILKEHALYEATITGRYQSLTPGLYAGATGLTRASYALDKHWINGTPGSEGGNNEMYMPVYAFNLSSMPVYNITENLINYQTVPFYRLRKIERFSPNTDSTTHNYLWDAMLGQNQDLATTPYWTVERIKGAPISLSANAAPSIVQPNLYNWKWSQIELAIASDSPQPRKVHVSLVRFKNIAAAPRRHYNTTNAGSPMDPTSAYDTNPIDDKVVSQADLWYDAWLARKTTHPLRSVEPMHRSNPIQFIKTECICLEPGMNEQDPIFTQKIFHTANKLMYCSNAQDAEAWHKANINTGPSGTRSIPPVFNQDRVHRHQSAFPNRWADTWVMIWADDFGPPQSTVATTFPLTFDLKIRSCFSFQRL